jgi:hypothetical protein
VCRFHVVTGWRCTNKLSLMAPLLECHAASGHHLQSFVSVLLDWLPWFITEGKLAAIFIKPSLGVSIWPVIYYTPTSFLAPSNTIKLSGIIITVPSFWYIFFGQSYMWLANDSNRARYLWMNDLSGPYALHISSTMSTAFGPEGSFVSQGRHCMRHLSF